jgi:phage terminase large subunit
MDYKNLISKGKILKVIIFPDFWIEEATELEEEDFQQLTLRLRGLTDSYKQITLTFNPVTKDHWIYTKFFENNHPNTYN